MRHVVTNVLVLKGEEILLHRRAKELLGGGKWGLAGGYLELNETIAQGAEREVFEETGYRIKDLTLLKITDNPNRPGEDRQNVAFVLFCQALEKEGTPDQESTVQKWFKLDELPPKEEIAFDFYDDIQFYVDYMKKSFPLPVIR